MLIHISRLGYWNPTIVYLLATQASLLAVTKLYKGARTTGFICQLFCRRIYSGMGVGGRLGGWLRGVILWERKLAMLMLFPGHFWIKMTGNDTFMDTKVINLSQKLEQGFWNRSVSHSDITSVLNPSRPRSDTAAQHDRSFCHGPNAGL